MQHDKVESRSHFELTTDTPYLTLMGEIWGIYCEQVLWVADHDLMLGPSTKDKLKLIYVMECMSLAQHTVPLVKTTCHLWSNKIPDVPGFSLINLAHVMGIH